MENQQGEYDNVVNTNNIRGKNLSTIAILGSSKTTPVDLFSVLLQNALLKTVGETNNSRNNISETEVRIPRLTSRTIKKKMGSTIFEKQEEYKLHSWLSQLEETSKLIIYECDNSYSIWTKRCIRQADAILIVCDASKSYEPGELEKQLDTSSFQSRAIKILCLLHKPSVVTPKNTVAFLNARTWLSSHVHIKVPDNIFEVSRYLPNNESAIHPEDVLVADQAFEHLSRPSIPVRTSLSMNDFKTLHEKKRVFIEKLKITELDKHSDVARLSRYLLGSQIALIFGGGGSRGFAHAAIVRQIKDELDIPIDIVGGTSIGAVAAAHYGRDQTSKSVYKGLKRWADQMGNKLVMASDLTYPYVSFFSSKTYIDEMRHNFGDMQIEDLWVPYFCITTDISANKMRIHRHGHIWRWTVASSSFTPYLPPVIDPADGHHLVDGCYTNNLPADVARENYGALKVIAIDVCGPGDVQYDNYGEWCSGWKILWRKILYSCYLSSTKPKIPKMQEISTRLAQIMGEHRMQELKKQSYICYHKIPVTMFNVTDFNLFPDIVQVGSSYAKATFTSSYKKSIDFEVTEHYKGKPNETTKNQTIVADMEKSLNDTDFDPIFDPEMRRLSMASLGSIGGFSLN